MRATGAARGLFREVDEPVCRRPRGRPNAARENLTRLHARRDEHRAARAASSRADAYVFCAAELQGEQTKLVARVDARRPFPRGERVALRPPSGEVHVFDADSGERLGGA